jgi:hypothetical protein
MLTGRRKVFSVGGNSLPESEFYTTKKRIQGITPEAPLTASDYR